MCKDQVRNRSKSDILSTMGYGGGTLLPQERSNEAEPPAGSGSPASLADRKRDFMKTIGWLLLAFLWVSGCKPAAIPAADEPPLAEAERHEPITKQQIEEGARTYTHFATQDILFNRMIHIDWPPEAFDQQSRLLADLLTWSKHPEVVRSLVKHPDAKVRTLALGALFVSEDFEDLPLIASLEEDKSPSFLNIKDSGRSYAIKRNTINTPLNTIKTPRFTVPVSEIEEPQTVGNVARAMRQWYMTAAHQDQGTSFAEYWKPRAGRKTCASWYLARLLRATRQISPLQPEYQEDINRVLTEINALPPAERAWTQLYVRRGDLTDKWGNYLVDANCLASLEAVGPDSIVQFLQRKRVTDDPDLWFDDGKRGSPFFLMSKFVLQHAITLLRPQDAPLLLECEKERIESMGKSPIWAVAAAELTNQNDPAAAKSIIDDALLRFPGGNDQATLIGALWRFQGVTEKQRIVDWLYQAQAKANRESRSSSDHVPSNFLRQVRVANRPDTRPLLAAIVMDSRFDETDYWTLELLLETVNAGLPEPLCDMQEVGNASPRFTRPDQQALHAKWRGVLRRHFEES